MLARTIHTQLWHPACWKSLLVPITHRPHLLLHVQTFQFHGHLFLQLFSLMCSTLTLMHVWIYTINWIFKTYSKFPCNDFYLNCSIGRVSSYRVEKEEIIDNINLEILTQVRKFQWRKLFGTWLRNQSEETYQTTVIWSAWYRESGKLSSYRVERINHWQY